MSLHASYEIYWLTLTVMLTGVMWMPIIVNRILEKGVWATLLPPQLKASANWANRLRQAHANAVENLVIFIPLVLALEVTKLNTSFTEMLCSVYFYSRLLHLITYLMAIPVVRTFAFLTGFVCQVLMALRLLGMT